MTGTRQGFQRTEVRGQRSEDRRQSGYAALCAAKFLLSSVLSDSLSSGSWRCRAG
ncbi:MAG: hypothetical protein LBD06_01415 [Candidatus Accumulibacter sp.]|nr:hypothetical protein [Accumulibacter sp.]